MLAALSAARAAPIRMSRILPRRELAPCTINRRLGPVDIVPQEASEKSCSPASFRSAALIGTTAVVLVQSRRDIAVESSKMLAELLLSRIRAARRRLANCFPQIAMAPEGGGC